MNPTRVRFSFCRPAIILFAVFLLLFTNACHKDKPAQPAFDFSYNYYPDEVGRYVIYQVDSTWQDTPDSIRKAVHYLLKEKIAAIFNDNAGRPTMRIERYYNYNYNPAIPFDSMAWIGPRVWTATKTKSTLERKEENTTYQRLVFPVRQGKQWNGNVYNTFPEKDYSIDSTDVAMTVNNLHFDSVAVVNQYQENNLVKYQYEKEKYARNVGLIFKQRDSLYFSSKSGSLPFNDTVGYRFTQKIISYGKK